VTHTSWPPPPTALEATPPDPNERLVVVVPCYNEEANVEETFVDIAEEIPKIPMPTVIVFVDDGSTDRTKEKIEKLCKDHAFCHAIWHSENRGLGASILEGVAWARPEDWVTIMPGDNEFVFASVHQFIQARTRYDVVLGYYQNPIFRTMTRRLASEAFVKIVRLVYGFPFRYLNGFYFFRARCFQGLQIASSGHAFGPELIAKALLREPLLRVGERPFAARGRAIGESKAFRPRAVAHAVREFVVGVRSTSQYREELLQGRSKG
jgi:glycosyltransferase involved in cell wall biosynthesis